MTATCTYTLKLVPCSLKAIPWECYFVCSQAVGSLITQICQVICGLYCSNTECHQHLKEKELQKLIAETSLELRYRNLISLRCAEGSRMLNVVRHSNQNIKGASEYKSISKALSVMQLINSLCILSIVLETVLFGETLSSVNHP